jgi:hypothetical protein
VSPDSLGAAYRVDGTTGAVKQTFVNPGPFDARTDFGTSFAANGDYIVISDRYARLPEHVLSGRVYVYDAHTGEHLRTIQETGQVVHSEFGSSVALSGNRLLVGAPGGNDGRGTGKAVLYDVSSGALLRTFMPLVVGDQFRYGAAVALSENNAFVSHPGEWPPVLYMYDINNGARIGLLRPPLDPLPGFYKWGDSLHVAEDYLLVRTSEHSVMVYAANSHAIPEPGTVGIATIAVVFCCWLRKLNRPTSSR